MRKLSSVLSRRVVRFLGEQEYLPYISPVSPLYLPYISRRVVRFLGEQAWLGLGLGLGLR